MPGMSEGSWGYHGEDGRLFVDGDLGRKVSTATNDPGWFRAGSVVGCGLDMTTGDGFCTLNGEKLNIG